MDTLIQSAVPRPVYSYHWAEGVVKRWIKAHPRVTEELWKYPYFSVENLADLLISQPKTWYSLKMLIKKTEEILRSPRFASKSTTQALTEALKFFPNHETETGFVTLTASLLWSTFWEPIE